MQSPRSVFVFCEQPMQQPLHLHHMFVMLSQQRTEGRIANQYQQLCS